MLFDQVDTIHHVDIPDLQTQLGGLQERMDEFPDPFSTPFPMERAPLLEDRAEVNANIQALQSIVREMRLLRETSKAEMAADLEAIKDMRANAMANIIEAQAQAVKASQTPVLLSLKRKRDDTDVNENVDESEDIQQEAAVDITDGVIDLINQDKDVVVVDEDVSVPLTKAEFLEAAAKTHRQVDGPPPRKRTRRIASVLAQTATAVTIGAVVTWSALAFS
jgi:valyl-tRNA synthetase